MVTVIARVADRPLWSVTLRTALYCPGVVYAWLAVWPVASKVPLPSKSHWYVRALGGVTSSNDALPSNSTGSLISAVVGLAWGTAVGGVLGSPEVPAPAAVKP